MYILEFKRRLSTFPAEADPGGGLRELQPPPIGKFSKLYGYPCLSLFRTKNNIISYNISSSPIDRYKKTVAILLLDSLIIQCRIDFPTKIATSAICFVSCHQL